MPQPTPEAIEISGREKAILESVQRRQTAPQWLVTRIRIILQAETGKTNSRIAEELKITRNTVREWRKRWQMGKEKREVVAAQSASDKDLEVIIEEQLRDGYRSGAPGKFSAEQIAGIIAIACEDPSANGYPISHWSPKEVTAEAIKRQIVDTISERQVGRFLKRGSVETTSESLLAQHHRNRPSHV